MILGMCFPKTKDKKQTRNQKHHIEGNAIPAECNYAKCNATLLQLIAILLVVLGTRKYMAQSLRPVVYVFDLHLQNDLHSVEWDVKL